jgi:IPT/TIG domain-containing protein
MICARPVRLLALALCVLAVPASSALAGKKGASPPSVSSLTPLTLRVGDTLTIRGRNFVPGKKRDKVTFKSEGSPAVSVKAAEATRTRMKVVVPAALAKYVTAAGGTARPSRFRIRVVAGRSAARGYTALKRSPLIVPANVPAAGLDQLGALDDSCGTDTGGVIDSIEGDGDSASDVSDPAAETDPCPVAGMQDDLGDDQ